MLAIATGISAVKHAATAALRYGATERRAAEEGREEARQSLVRELRQRFVDDPVLVLPSGGSETSLAMGATPIPGIGTVFFSTFRSTNGATPAIIRSFRKRGDRSIGVALLGRRTLTAGRLRAAEHLAAWAPPGIESIRDLPDARSQPGLLDDSAAVEHQLPVRRRGGSAAGEPR